MKIIKIEPKYQFEWEEIFDSWSKEMDRICTEEERHDATRWADNPAEWMEPFVDQVFNAWMEYDAPNPGQRWEDYLIYKNLIRDMSEEEFKQELCKDKKGNFLLVSYGKYPIAEVRFREAWVKIKDKNGRYIPNNFDFEFFIHQGINKYNQIIKEKLSENKKDGLIEEVEEK